MKRIIIALAAIGGLVATPALAGVDARQHNQRDRIAQGWRSGALTPRETGSLARQQYRVGRAEARMRSDGHFSYRERARIRARQDRASANIYRKKHNGRGW